MRILVAILTLVLLSVSVQAATPNPDMYMTYFLQVDPNDPNSDVLMTVLLELKTLETGNTDGVTWTDYSIERAVFTEWIDGATTIGRVWSENFPNLKSGYTNFHVVDGEAVSFPIDDNAISPTPLVPNMDIDSADGDDGITFENSDEIIIIINPEWIKAATVDRTPVQPVNP